MKSCGESILPVCSCREVDTTSSDVEGRTRHQVVCGLGVCLGRVQLALEKFEVEFQLGTTYCRVCFRKFLRSCAAGTRLGKIKV